MSSVKISALPSAGVLLDTDTIPVVRSGVTSAVTTGAVVASSVAGYCRLQVDSTTQLSLQRYQGSTLPINGVVTAIPASGPTLGTGGLAASTLYYVYAFLNAGTLTLEASTTAHATNSATGVEQKSGDATRTLVGMVFTDAAIHFVDSVTTRHLANWFNRSLHDLRNTFSTNRSTTSTVAFVELNAEIQISFLAWGDESVSLGVTGTAKQDSSGQALATGLGIDSTSAPSVATSFTASANNNRQSVSLTYSQILSEGHHFATILCEVSTGTATYETPTSVGTGVIANTLWGVTRI